MRSSRKERNGSRPDAGQTGKPCREYLFKTPVFLHDTHWTEADPKKLRRTYIELTEVEDAEKCTI
jgi:hypothetical protein